MIVYKSIHKSELRIHSVFVQCMMRESLYETTNTDIRPLDFTLLILNVRH